MPRSYYEKLAERLHDAREQVREAIKHLQKYNLVSGQKSASVSRPHKFPSKAFARLTAEERKKMEMARFEAHKQRQMRYHAAERAIFGKYEHLTPEELSKHLSEKVRKEIEEELANTSPDDSEPETKGRVERGKTKPRRAARRLNDMDYSVQSLNGDYRLNKQTIATATKPKAKGTKAAAKVVGLALAIKGTKVEDGKANKCTGKSKTVPKLPRIKPAAKSSPSHEATITKTTKAPTLAKPPKPVKKNTAAAASKKAPIGDSAPFTDVPVSSIDSAPSTSTAITTSSVPPTLPARVLRKRAPAAK